MDSGERGFQGGFGDLLVVVGLEIEPHLGWPSEIAFEAQGGIHGEGTLALDDFVDPPGRDADVLGYPVFRKTEGDQEILAQDFAGMDGRMCFHGGSVVIDDFNFVRAVGFPAETDAPLVIDANGVLPHPVALEGFRAVAGWDGKMVEFGDGMKLGEFAQGDTLDVRRKRPGFPFLEEECGFPKAKERIIGSGG